MENKKDNMYNRLDPISAKSMPKTGDPTIDKKVEKAKKKNKAWQTLNKTLY